MRTTLRHVVAAVTLSGIVACSDENVANESTSPGFDSRLKVTLSAQTDTVLEASSKSISARVTDFAGNLKLVPVSWTSSDPSVLSVNQGTITGVAAGSAMVVASAGGGADTALIVVLANEETLDVQPSAAVVALGDTVDFIATVRTQSGEIVSVSQLSWTSSDTNAATFVKEGTMIAKAEGELSVNATSASRRGSGSVRVFKSPVYSVTISPSSANVYKGSQLELDVELRDQQGRFVEGEVTFGSSDYTKATVNQDGIVTGLNAGTVVITATSGTKTGSATVTVLGTPASTVTVSLSPDTILVGHESQVSATLLDASGNVVTNRSVAYQSSNPSVATITSTPTVKGVTEGFSNISAIVDGKVSTKRIYVKGRTAASLSINPGAPSVTVGQSSQLSAKVLDQLGVEITGQSITWSSANQAIASVSQSGVVSGLTSGMTTISATSGSLSGSAVVSVVNASVASVRVSPTATTLTKGGSPVSLTATAYDASENVLSGRVASWASSNPIVASVSSSGVVSAIGAGSATITATIEGKSATATVTVGSPPPAAAASVTVTLASGALNVGQQTQATAVVKDAQGNVLARTVQWTSLDTAVAKVSESGVVTAFAGGTVAIVGSVDQLSGAASLTVSTPAPVAVAQVILDAPSAQLSVGQSVQSTVVLKDAQGNVLPPRTTTYSTMNPAVVTISASGVITAMGVGSTTVKATSGGVTGSKAFSVVAATSPTVATITVSPASAALAVGQTSSETAIAKDAQGNVMSGVTFTWTTTSAQVATVSSSGVVSAVGAGSATIRAAASGVTGSMSVNVTAPAPATVASVTLTLSSTSIVVGGTAQATAVAKDAQGNTITGRPVTWSGGGTLATISSTGLVTALQAGVVPVTATIDGISKTASLTITAPTLLPPPTTSAVVELPRVFLNYSYPAKTGQTIVVPAGGNLQTALNNAQRGDEIVLTAGATYTGNFVLPAKAGTAANGWIVVRSDKLSQLPPQGTRVTASHASLMPKIVTSTPDPALKTGGAAHGWWLAGLEVTVAPSLTIQQYGILVLGEGGATQKTLADVPHDLVVDRSYIHGQTTTNTSRCVELDAGRAQITDSRLAECHGKDFDSQAIGGWNGPGPYKIVNNYLAGAGENLMFGGTSVALSGNVPSDIEIRRNHFETPLSWKGVWQKKNLLELKNAARVLIEGNIFEGSWVDGQTGWAIIVRDDGCTHCFSRDVTIRRNLVRKAGAGIQAGSPLMRGTTRVMISENVLDSLAMGSYTGDQRGFAQYAPATVVTVERNLLSGGNISAAFWAEGGAPCVAKDNVLNAGSYGLIASGWPSGKPSWDAFCGKNASSLWSANTMIGNSYGNPYPAGTTWYTSEGQSSLAAQLRSIVQQATAGVIVP